MSTPFAELDAIHQATPTNLDQLDQRMLYQSDATMVERSGDNKLFVKFYARQVRNEEKSMEAGRAIHEEKVYINIKLPGDKHNDVNRVAFPEDIKRFPLHYERFRKNQEQVIGTPLNVLPFLTEAQVEDYRVIHIRTVEQLAGLADVTAQQIMGSVAHKHQAQAWLDRFNSVEKVREEFDAKDRAREEEMKTLKAQIEALTKAQAAISNPPQD